MVKVYKGEAIGSKKFYVKNYGKYKMVDNKFVLKQAKDFQKIVDAIIVAGMYLDPVFDVNMLISKLPPSWQDYKIKAHA